MPRRALPNALLIAALVLPIIPAASPSVAAATPGPTASATPTSGPKATPSATAAATASPTATAEPARTPASTPTTPSSPTPTATAATPSPTPSATPTATRAPQPSSPAVKTSADASAEDVLEPQVVWAWGLNASGQLGSSTSETCQSSPCSRVPLRLGALSDATALSGGGAHSLAIKSDGTVWAWGDNAYGQLGNGTTTGGSNPVQVKGPGGSGVLTGVAGVAGGGAHSLGLKSDGTVWAWGSNTDGQLGIGRSKAATCNVSGTRSPCSLTPVQVKGSGGSGFLSGVTAVAAVGNSSLALKSDGSVWGWGDNLGGQLGDGSTTDRDAPVQVKGPNGSGFLSGVAAIGMGYTFSGGHGLALKSDGTVWGWGANDQGQLGDGTTTFRTTPVQVSGLTSVVAVAGGYEHTHALKADGTVWGWGKDSSAELGDGVASARRMSPVQVKGPGGSGVLSGVTAIAKGTRFGHTLALRSDGTVWGWGWDGLGQLGNGGATPPNCSGEPCVDYPIQVSTLGAVTAIAAGGAHSLALVAGPPSGTVTISPKPYAGSTAVTLTLSAQGRGGGAVTEMQISGDGAATGWIPYSISHNWTLTGGDGQKIVNVAFKNAAGFTSATAQDATTLDTTPPTAATLSELGATTETSPIGLIWTPSTDSSGIAKYTLSYKIMSTDPATGLPVAGDETTLTEFDDTVTRLDLLIGHAGTYEFFVEPTDKAGRNGPKTSTRTTTDFPFTPDPRQESDEYDPEADSPCIPPGQDPYNLITALLLTRALCNPPPVQRSWQNVVPEELLLCRAGVVPQSGMVLLPQFDPVCQSLGQGPLRVGHYPAEGPRERGEAAKNEILRLADDQQRSGDLDALVAEAIRRAAGAVYNRLAGAIRGNRWNFANGDAVQLQRMTTWLKAKRLRGGESPANGRVADGRVQMQLESGGSDSNIILELKHWSRKWLNSDQGQNRLIAQLRDFLTDPAQPNQRVLIEITRTSRSPVSPSDIQALRPVLKDAGIDGTRVMIRIVENVTDDIPTLFQALGPL